ncbi:hypothetical protein [Dokdonella sp.]|uniref:hypothetical protein n=1 Tax=Dokdonella sp. TaxID=2291710 RepID=UPI0035282C72
MSKIWIGLAFAAFSGCVSAQVCTPTAGNITGAQSGIPLPSYDTCTATDQLAVSCSGLNPIGNATDAIWSVQVGPGAHSGSMVISTSNAAYDIYVGLMSGSCNGSSPCPLEADSAGAGGTETLGPMDSLANGTYYLLVTTFGAGCGPVTITNPTLPVALQEFSVE